MCGRFVSASPPDEIARYFDADVAERMLEPNYNVAPTDDVPVVLDEGSGRRLDAFHWGLVPFWADNPSVGNRMINARAESLTSKGAFKHAFRRRRCIVPADGFFEWKKVPGRAKKQPYYIHRPDGEPLALAGLWEKWRPPGPKRPGNETLRSCTIVTTSANEALAALHDRMPVILPRSAWERWLDPDDDELDTLSPLLAPVSPEYLAMRPVGTDVNDVRTTGPDLIRAVGPETTDQIGTQGTHM